MVNIKSEIEFEEKMLELKYLMNRFDKGIRVDYDKVVELSEAVRKYHKENK